MYTQPFWCKSPHPPQSPAIMAVLSEKNESMVPNVDVERGGALQTPLLSNRNNNHNRNHAHSHSHRTGNLWTTSAHIITTVIGSGVLSLAWSMAQLGWLAGFISIFIFALITYYTCILLADCYRSPDPLTGKRNVNYTQAVRNILGDRYVIYCGITQYTIMVGTCIGYTITAATSIVAMLRFNCHHQSGGQSSCEYSEKTYMMAFGLMEVLLSQIPDFHQLWWLSIVAAIMSFSYASIGLGFSVSKVIENGAIQGSMLGLMEGITPADKVWRVFQALGDVAFAYAFSQVFFEIQDAIKSPPSEVETMKKATLLGSSTTTFFYVLCACSGYAAFGNNASGNLLSESGFTEPYWLLIAANAFIVIHLVGAYQVLCQPVFATVERYAWSTFFDGKSLKKYNVEMLPMGPYTHLFRLLWRAIFVLVITNISMFLPFFNDILGIVGSLSFWPLGVFFPIEMYMSQNKIEKWTRRWCLMRSLSIACLVISLMALMASIVGVVQELGVRI